MNIKHVVNVFNNRQYTQHRLLVDKRCILEGVYATGSKGDVAANECMEMYVTAKAKEIATATEPVNSQPA